MTGKKLVIESKAAIPAEAAEAIKGLLEDRGWFDHSDNEQRPTLIEAVVKAARWYGVDGTDELTLISRLSRLVLRPRICGHADNVQAFTGGLGRAPKWTRNDLTWGIASSWNHPSVEPLSIQMATQEACNRISAVCGVRFSYESERTPDITIFNGELDFRPYGTLAISELANGTNTPLKQTYDNREPFTLDIPTPQGMIDLTTVVCHELIHALGVSHRRGGGSQPALMDPALNPGVDRPQSWDIQQLQLRYGPPSSPPVPSPQPQPTPTPVVPQPSLPQIPADLSWLGSLLDLIGRDDINIANNAGDVVIRLRNAREIFRKIFRGQ